MRASCGIAACGRARRTARHRDGRCTLRCALDLGIGYSPRPSSLEPRFLEPFAAMRARIKGGGAPRPHVSLCSAPYAPKLSAPPGPALGADPGLHSALDICCVLLICSSRDCRRVAAAYELDEPREPLPQPQPQPPAPAPAPAPAARPQARHSGRRQAGPGLRAARCLAEPSYTTASKRRHGRSPAACMPACLLAWSPAGQAAKRETRDTQAAPACCMHCTQARRSAEASSMAAHALHSQTADRLADTQTDTPASRF